MLKMNVFFRSYTVYCSLTVLNYDGPSLCKRDMLQKLREEGVPVLHVKEESTLRSPSTALLERYAELFTDRTGLLKDPPARL